MPYEVVFEAKVLKAMRHFPDADQRRLLSVGWRLRVGDYRVIYRIDEMEETIIITRVSQRGDVYRKR